VGSPLHPGLVCSGYVTDFSVTRRDASLSAPLLHKLIYRFVHEPYDNYLERCVI
jgi:hypothetical protein